jgi:hypothetical protein
MPVSHWIHTFAENPFGCNFAPQNCKAMLYKTLLFILGFALIPVLMVTLPLLAGIGYGIYGCLACSCVCLILRNTPCLLRFVIFIFTLPLSPIALAFSIACGALVSAICAILVIPALIVHCYMFIRSVIWWSKTKRHSR